MEVEARVLCFGRGRSAAQMSRVAGDLVAERLARERVVGQRHRKVRQLRGE